MKLGSDLSILFQLVFHRCREQDLKERLDGFYSKQADKYDSFRNRFLHGREDLWKELPVPEGGIWIDVGGGIGMNLVNLGDKINRLQKVYIVDLAESLLNVARKRIQDQGWTNVEVICADATKWTPPEGKADVITFSYSLTMIPDWFIALEQAVRNLKPNGVIGVVDFYISRHVPREKMKKHGWLTRTFWPIWFAFSGVYPSSEHLPWLLDHFDQIFLEERREKILYFPLFWWKMPYFLFVGKKREPEKFLPANNNVSFEPVPENSTDNLK